jgi:glutathione peroxidase
MKLFRLLSLLLLAQVAPAKPNPSFFDLAAVGAQGKVSSLQAYQGKVCLVVNVASQCGFTSQYGGLQKLYESRKEQGLMVLGFPSNDFGGQEPGSDGEIQTFCKANYGVTFPVFAKVGVRSGDQQSPVYQFLTASGKKPSWNFGKYLVGRDGRVIGFFGSTVAPDSKELLQAVDAALASKATSRVK